MSSTNKNKSIKILIVDDDKFSRQALKNILEQIGKCDVVGNGLEALDAFRLSNFSKKPYNLITLDIMMPVMNGMQLLSKIRGIEKNMEIPESKQIKVLMVTAQCDENSVMESSTAGCQEYLVKPFIPKTVIKKVKKLGIEVSNEELIHNTVDMEDMVIIFIRELGNRISRLEEYIATNNITNIRQIAHQLHGTGSTYGFFNVTKVGAEIEEAAEKEDWPSIKIGINTLTELYDGYRTIIT